MKGEILKAQLAEICKIFVFKKFLAKTRKH